MQWLTYLYNSFLTATKVAFLRANKLGVFRHFPAFLGSNYVSILCFCSHNVSIKVALLHVNTLGVFTAFFGQ